MTQMEPRPLDYATPATDRTERVRRWLWRVAKCLWLVLVLMPILFLIYFAVFKSNPLGKH